MCSTEPLFEFYFNHAWSWLTASFVVEICKEKNYQRDPIQSPFLTLKNKQDWSRVPQLSDGQGKSEWLNGNKKWIRGWRDWSKQSLLELFTKEESFLDICIAFLAVFVWCKEDQYIKNIPALSALYVMKKRTH